MIERFSMQEDAALCDAWRMTIHEQVIIKKEIVNPLILIFIR